MIKENVPKPPEFKTLSSRRNRLVGLPFFSRTKDIRYYPYFQSPLSRGIWFLLSARLTRISRWLVLITLLFFFYGSNSLDIQGYVPLLYLLNVWAVAVVSLLLFRPDFKAEAKHADRISVGETLPIDIEVEQRRRKNQVETTLIPLCLPPGLEVVPEDGVRLPPLPFGEKAKFQLRIKCLQRGVQEWQGFRIETDFPFNILRSYRNLWKPHVILVYPQYQRLNQVDIPTGRVFQPGGIVMASIQGDSFEYLGNREYREGDNLKNMDWRATARLNIPIVREYREEYFLRVGVVLDTYVPAKMKSQKAQLEEYENFERAISICASVSECMARSEYIVDLFAAGPNLFHLTAGRSLAYLDQILEILANVEENNEEPFEVMAPELMENLAQMTSVICILTDWNPIRQRFVDELQQMGAGLKVIIVRDRPTSLDDSQNSLPHGIRVISKADFVAGIAEL